MISGTSSYHIRKATLNDIDALKRIADTHKRELGFLRRPTLIAAIERQEIFVAEDDGEIVAFVEYHHRRDQQTTLYNIVVQSAYQRQGVGKELIKALQTESQNHKKQFILLKCPADLPANNFYSDIGFTLISIEPGKRRQLNIWQWE